MYRTLKVLVSRTAFFLWLCCCYFLCGIFFVIADTTYNTPLTLPQAVSLSSITQNSVSITFGVSLLYRRPIGSRDFSSLSFFLLGQFSAWGKIGKETTMTSVFRCIELRLQRRLLHSRVKGWNSFVTEDEKGFTASSDFSKMYWKMSGDAMLSKWVHFHFWLIARQANNLLPTVLEEFELQFNPNSHINGVGLGRSPK